MRSEVKELLLVLEEDWDATLFVVDEHVLFVCKSLVNDLHQFGEGVLGPVLRFH